MAPLARRADAKALEFLETRKPSSSMEEKPGRRRLMTPARTLPLSPHFTRA